MPAIAVLRTVLLSWSTSRRAGLGCAACRRRSARALAGPVQERWYLILPLLMLVWFCLGGYTPLFSGMVAWR